MTMFFVSTACALPSLLDTSSLPAPRIFPVPWMTSILFFFIRNSTPLTLPSMPCCLKFIIEGRSSFGGGTLTPILANECAASSNISDACNSAFDGMQPILRQVPPSVSFFSTTATFMPSWAARMAQTYPPGPVPMTTRS